MELGEVFVNKNKKFIFDRTPTTEFVAKVTDNYSDFIERNIINHEWAWSFPAGRYVIIVYQRHSIYEGGKLVWKNIHYVNTVGDSRYKGPAFELLIDPPIEYYNKKWNRKYLSEVIRDENDDYQTKLLTLEEAQAEAEYYSSKGYKAAIMEWYADYDQY